MFLYQASTKSFMNRSRTSLNGSSIIEAPDSRLSSFHVSRNLANFRRTVDRPLDGGLSGRF